MAEWIEIPVRRVLVLDLKEFGSEWERLNSEGGACESNVPFVLARRRRDGKVMRLAQFKPALVPEALMPEVLDMFREKIATTNTDKTARYLMPPSTDLFITLEEM